MGDPVLTLTAEVLAAAATADQAAKDQLQQRAQDVIAKVADADAPGLVAAVNGWRSALGQVAGAAGTSPGDLLLRVLALPPVPGLADGLVPLLASGASTLAGGWRPGGTVGPATVGVDLDAVAVGVPGAPLLVLGLLPPSGAHLGLAAGPVKGSGSLSLSRQPHPRYAGRIGAGAGTVSVAAAAVLEEPPGKALALVLVLAARFTPGIQIGFGFEVSTVGGLVGVNRRADTDAIRARLASGEALSALFPTDPDGAARSLPGSLEAMFPARPGGVVAGPAVEVTWLQVAGYSLLRLSLAALLELPAARLIVLGRGVISVPPVLSLRVDVAGEIDPGRGLVAMDAALVDSVVFAIFRVGGTGALRVQTGGRPYALVTIGGFFPGYRVEAPGLPQQQRISLTPTIPLPLSVRAEGYIAITDGTFQVGGSIEAGFDAGVLAASGHLSIDAIAQLDPFRFRGEFSAGFDVEALGMDFGGVNFSGWVEGPGPIVIGGRVEVKFLGAKAGWNDRFVLGSVRAPAVAPISQLADLIAATVVPVNLRASGGDDPHVGVRPAQTPPPAGVPARALASPLGTVAWSQTVAPLGLLVAKAANRNLGAAQIAHAKADVGVPVEKPREWFSPASFIAADRNLLLLLPAFDRFEAGLGVRFELESGAPPATKNVTFAEVYRTDMATKALAKGPGDIGAPLSLALQTAIEGRSAAATARRKDPTLEVVAEAWAARQPGTTPASRARTSRTAALLDTLAGPSVALPLAEPAVDAAALKGP